jgi:hypothetical protein
VRAAGFYPVYIQRNFSKLGVEAVLGRVCFSKTDFYKIIF